MMITALLLAATLSPFEQVVAAERAFAAASVTKGMDPAFLDYLAQDSIAFLPLPAPARPAHEGKPQGDATLTWGPAWVVVSSAGDLAVSTGPWQVRTTKQTLLKVNTGWFLSIWRRQADGAWKVAVDAGISSALPYATPKSVENGFAGDAATAHKPADAAQARIGVTTAERAFSSAAKSGIGGAVLAHVDPSVRAYREGEAAGVGLVAARALLATDKRKVTCTPDRITAAASGDLGYAYGTCAGEGGDGSKKYGFLHVWRKQADGTWRILVDVTP